MIHHETFFQKVVDKNPKQICNALALFEKF